jgi:hypothetical protein
MEVIDVVELDPTGTFKDPNNNGLSHQPMWDNRIFTTNLLIFDYLYKKIHDLIACKMFMWRILFK